MTPEDKQRIEEEERYRAEVRSRISHEHEVEKQRDSEAEPTHAGRNIVIAFVVFVAIVLFVVYLNSPKLSDQREKQMAASQKKYVPASISIATGQIVVPAGSDTHYTFSIGSDAVQPRVIGSFNAAGGSGNDIVVALLTDTEYPNWANGHTARLYYNSGKETTGSFNVGPLPVGNYVLVFDNHFSAISQKYIGVQADLKYLRVE